MTRRNENPLGIRKLDVQHERSAMERTECKEKAAGIARLWGIEDPEAIRCLSVLYAMGWQEGVKVGAEKTRGRVAEALKRGTLVKP